MIIINIHKYIYSNNVFQSLWIVLKPFGSLCAFGLQKRAVMGPGFIGSGLVEFGQDMMSYMMRFLMIFGRDVGWAPHGLMGEGRPPQQP